MTLAIGSAAGSALIFKRKRERNASRADLYFEDGSMLSLAQGAPEADRPLPLAVEAPTQEFAALSFADSARRAGDATRAFLKMRRPAPSAP